MVWDDSAFSLERTILANERTLLAYIRTAFSSLLVAILLLKFLENGITDYLGMIFLILSFIIIALGVIYYFMRKKTLLVTFHSLTKRK